VYYQTTFQDPSLNVFIGLSTSKYLMVAMLVIIGGKKLKIKQVEWSVVA